MVRAHYILSVEQSLQHLTFFKQPHVLDRPISQGSPLVIFPSKPPPEVDQLVKESLSVLAVNELFNFSLLATLLCCAIQMEKDPFLSLLDKEASCFLQVSS